MNVFDKNGDFYKGEEQRASGRESLWTMANTEAKTGTDSW